MSDPALRRASAGLAALALFVGACADAGEAAEELPEQVDFARHIAPLVHEHCAACHRDGGSAPFALITYADAGRRADQLDLVTSMGLMPPWLPAAGKGEFARERRLSAHELALLARWVEQGAPEGDPALTPAPPEFPEGWTLGEPDLALEFGPWTLPAEGRDVFRNFVLRVPLREPRFVEGLEFRPHNGSVVHHVNIMVDRTASSREADAAEPGQGFEGMMDNQAKFPDGHFVGWTPGKQPFRAEPGMAWRLEPGTDLVLQLHLLPTGKPEDVGASVGLYFADEPPTRLPSMVRLGPKTIDIPAGEGAYTIEESFRLPVDVLAYGVYPHAHYLARDMQGKVRLPSGEERWLLHIPEWDFDWQDEYRFKEPLALPAGSELSMRYTYDNSARNPRNPSTPARRVVYGPASSDEMGDLWVQVLAANPPDRARLEEELSGKRVVAEVTGLRTMLAADPENAGHHYDLGTWYLKVERPAEALVQFETSARLDPDFAFVHHNRGLALGKLGRVAEAEAALERALELDPGLVASHAALGNLLQRAGRAAAAETHFRAAIAADGEEINARNSLGRMLLGRGESEAAFALFREAIALRPKNPLLRYNFGVALEGAGRGREALDEFRRALAARPGWPPALGRCAWLLATLPAAAGGDPAQAQALAQAAVQASSGRDVLALDALGAAQAALGRFAEARKSAQAALALGAGPREAGLRARLEAYRAERPAPR